MANTNETYHYGPVYGPIISNYEKEFAKNCEKSIPRIVDAVKEFNPKATCCFVPMNEKTGKNLISNKTMLAALGIPSGKELTKAVRKMQTDLVKNISFNLENRQVVKDNVVYNKKILHTTVYFIDGTYVKVSNSENDPITTETIIPKQDIPGANDVLGKMVKCKKISKRFGTDPVEVASESAKEQAVLYAMFKKLMNPGVENGEIAGNGYISEIHKLIKAKAVDQNLKPWLKKIEKFKGQIKHNKLLKDAQYRRYKKINTGNILDVLKNMDINDLRDFVFDLLKDVKSENAKPEYGDKAEDEPYEDDPCEDEDEWEEIDEDEWEEDDSEPPLFDDEDFEDTEPLKDPHGDYSPKKEV